MVLLLINLTKVNAGTFTSVASGSWNVPANWTVVGDADGIPDFDDDITVNVGHTMTVPTTSYGNNVTIDGTVTINSGGVLYIKNNYTLNGTEAGSGAIGFTVNTSAIISGGGVFGTSVRYSFSASKTIAVGTVIIKAATTGTSIASNATLTNNGTFSIGQVGAGTNSTILNTSTGTLFIRSSLHASSTVIIDAQAAGNTVNYDFSNASGVMKSPLNGIFHHLTISGTTTKSLQTSVTVNGNFTVQPSSGFNFNNQNLTVKGNFNMSSTLYTQQSASILTLDGTAAQNFGCTGAAVSNIPNLVINNAMGVTTTAGIIRIANYLEIQSGNFNAGTNRITLLSTAGTTARIAESAGTISGSMIIQRYVSGRSDGFSDMSSPISNANFAQLSDDFAMIFAPYASPWTIIPSAWGYNETVFDYYAIETSGTAMTPGVGYEVYLDNDGDTVTAFAATTIDITGTPNMGDIAVAVTVNNDGWNLIGNPYACFIDFDDFRTTAGVAMGTTFLFYDETIKDFNSGGSGDELAQSQGFWIQANVAGTATFKESNKSTSTGSTYRNSNELLFTVRVKAETSKFTSNTYLRFNETAGLEYVADRDLTFLKVPSPSAPSLYTTSTEGIKLRINELRALESLSIPMNFKAGVNGNHTISAMNIENIQAEGYDLVILEDKKLDIFYDISSSNYEFTAEINDDEERFTLHFKSAQEAQDISLETVVFTQSAEGVFVNFNLDESTNAIIDVFNVAGQEISNPITTPTSVNRTKIIVPESYQGIYIVRVLAGDKIVTQKFYKQ